MKVLDNKMSRYRVPTVLERLRDLISKNLPNEDAMEWPERFLSAVPVGADLSRAWPRFATWMLRECLALTDNEEVHGILDLLAYLYETGVPDTDPRWTEARNAAYIIAHDTDVTYSTSNVALAATVTAYAVNYANAVIGVGYAACAVAVDARADFWKAAAEQLLHILSTSEKSMKYLVEGWHELAIDRAIDVGRRPLFVIEGRVLRSTAPDFAGEAFAYVTNLNLPLAVEILRTLAHESWKRCITESGDGSRTDRNVNGAIVLADTRAVAMLRSPGLRSVLLTNFAPPL